jgi:hypothetical protein
MYMRGFELLRRAWFTTPKTFRGVVNHALHSEPLQGQPAIHQ